MGAVRGDFWNLKLDKYNLHNPDKNLIKSNIWKKILFITIKKVDYFFSYNIFDLNLPDKVGPFAFFRWINNFVAEA